MTFIRQGEAVYDPDLGEFRTGEGQELVVPCFVMDLGLEKSKLLFGEYAKDRQAVYIQRPIPGGYGHCRYGGKLYKLTRDKLSQTVFYLEGDDSLG